MEVMLRVARFDPGVDGRARFGEYSLRMAGERMVLDALLAVRDEQDGSLAFRTSCRSGICGSCALMVGGRPRLACQTPLAEAAEDGVITLEPLAGFRVLRDLVVDVEPFLASLRAVAPWLVVRPDHDGRMAPAAVAEVEPASLCILCGICEVGQPHAGTGLTALTKAYRLALDPRDALGPERVKLAVDLGLLARPLPEGMACPKDIDFAGCIVPGLRRLTVQRERGEKSICGSMNGGV